MSSSHPSKPASSSAEINDSGSSVSLPSRGIALADEYQKISQRVADLAQSGTSLDHHMLYGYDQRLDIAKKIGDDEVAQFAIVQAKRPDLLNQLTSDMEASGIREEAKDDARRRDIELSLYGQQGPTPNAKENLDLVGGRLRESIQDPQRAAEAALISGYYREISKEVIRDPSDMAELSSQSPKTAYAVLATHYPERELLSPTFLASRQQDAAQWFHTVDETSAAAVSGNVNRHEALKSKRFLQTEKMQDDPAISYAVGRSLAAISHDDLDKATRTMGVLSSDADALQPSVSRSIHEKTKKIHEDAEQALGANATDPVQRYVYFSSMAFEAEKSVANGRNDPSLATAFRQEARSELSALIVARGDKSNAVALEIASAAQNRNFPVDQMQQLYSQDRKALETPSNHPSTSKTRAWVPIGGMPPSVAKEGPVLDPDPTGRVKLAKSGGAMFSARAIDESEGSPGGLLHRYIPRRQKDVKAMLADPKTAAFLLPMSQEAFDDGRGNKRASSDAQFGMAMGGEVSKAVADMYKTEGGRKRVSELLEGTINAREAVKKTPAKAGAQDIQHEWSDQAELGFRALLQAVRKQDPELYQHWAPSVGVFNSNAANRVLQLNNKPVYGVRMGESLPPKQNVKKTTDPLVMMGRLSSAGRMATGIVGKVVSHGVDHGGARH